MDEIKELKNKILNTYGPKKESGIMESDIMRLIELVEEEQVNLFKENSFTSGPVPRVSQQLTEG